MRLQAILCTAMAGVGVATFFAAVAWKRRLRAAGGERRRDKLRMAEEAPQLLTREEAA